MLNRLLPVSAVLLTIVSWISTGLLLRAAWIKPRIDVLTERAIIAVLISLVGTVGVVLLIRILPPEPGWTIFRLVLLALLAVPSYWTWLYMSGRLGARDE